MILQFWLFVILLLIMASIIFILPFVRGYQTSIKKEDSMSRNQLNSDLYEVRLAEIEQDDAQGLIIDKENIIEELQHNLLDDIHETPSGIETRKNALIWLPGVLFLIIGSVGMYLSLGTYKEVKHLNHVLGNYKSLQHKLFDKSNQKVTQQDLNDFTLGLRVQLNKKPNDPSGWLLYSRLEMMFGHYGGANSAIDKAYSLDSQSIDIRLLYIELKMQSEDLDDQHKSQKMVVDLLKEDPNELDAWSLYAFMALQAKEYKSAIFRWNKMLKLVDPHSKKAMLIRDSIVFVQDKIAEKTKAQLFSEKVRHSKKPSESDRKNSVTNHIN